MSESTVPAKGRTDQTTPESTRGGVYFTPRVDIVETDKELVVYADKVEARFENGVLLVTLPKHESARPRRIQVKGE